MAFSDVASTVYWSLISGAVSPTRSRYGRSAGSVAGTNMSGMRSPRSHTGGRAR